MVPDMISMVKRNSCGKALEIARTARDMLGGAWRGGAGRSRGYFHATGGVFALTAPACRQRHLGRVPHYPALHELGGGEHVRGHARRARAHPRPRHHRHGGLHPGRVTASRRQERVGVPCMHRRRALPFQRRPESCCERSRGGRQGAPEMAGPCGQRFDHRNFRSQRVFSESSPQHSPGAVTRSSWIRPAWQEGSWPVRKSGSERPDFAACGGPSHAVGDGRCGRFHCQ